MRSAPVIPAWVSADGPAKDVVLSTRARLARNVRGSPFPSRAREADLRRVANLALEALSVIESEGRFGRLRVLQPERLRSAGQRLALADTYLASRQHARSGDYRPVALDEPAELSLMVNEEDHLRIQCILAGLQPLAALEKVRGFDACLARRIAYVRTDNYGYLTASLANVGTALRLSVMLHLAGLALLDEAVPALTAAAHLKISVRGAFGEGTKAFGHIYQVSNETAIGFTEQDITLRVRGAAEHLVSREREARRKLAAEKPDELTRRVECAYSRLMEAQALRGTEALEDLSMLRLGAELGLGPKLSPRGFKELLVSIRLGESVSGGESVGSEVRRAGLIRARLMEENQIAQLAFPEEQEQPTRRQIR